MNATVQPNNTDAPGALQTAPLERGHLRRRAEQARHHRVASRSEPQIGDRHQSEA